MSHRAIFSFLFFLNMSVTNNYFSYTTNSAYRKLKNTKPTVRKERERERKRETDRQRERVRQRERQRDREDAIQLQHGELTAATQSCCHNCQQSLVWQWQKGCQN